VDRFNNDESSRVFLISLKAGGTGSTSRAPTRSCTSTRGGTPRSKTRPPTARTASVRQGGHVYRLIARGTVEEKILQLSEKKRELMENVLSTEGTALKGLTKADNGGVPWVHTAGAGFSEGGNTRLRSHAAGRRVTHLRDRVGLSPT
jgi:non-specific serine/threonine protein kinase